MNLFKKKHKPRVSLTVLCDFSFQDISTGQVCNYICWLFRNYGFMHIGWGYKNDNGCLRCYLYTTSDSEFMDQYFRDRSNNEIANECKSAPDSRFKSVSWTNDIVEVIPVSEDGEKWS